MSKILRLHDEEVPTWASVMRDFMIAQKAGGRQPSTLKYYEWELGPFARWAEARPVALEAFTAKHMREYLAMRADRGVSENTRRHDATSVHLLLRFAVAEGMLEQDPLADYKTPRRSHTYLRAPTPAELRRLVLGVSERWDPSVNPKVNYVSEGQREFFKARDLAILTGQITTGCRPGEMLGLLMENVNIEGRRVTFAKTKSGEPREGLFEEGWVAILQAWLERRPPVKSPYVFLTIYGDPIATAVWRKQFRGYMAYADLAGFTPHRIRHYGVTEFAEVNLWAAQELAGHADSESTAVYLHAKQEHLRRVHDQAAPLGKVLVNTRYEKAKAARRKIA